MKKQNVILAVTMVLVAVLVLAVGQDAMAYTSGAAGDLGYDFWDISINKGLKGPVGATIGAVLAGAGIAGLAMGVVQKAGYGLVAAGVLITIPSIVSTMGMTF